MTQNDLLGIIFIGVIILTVIMMLPGPPPKEPDQKKKDELARELLKGGNIEEISKREKFRQEDLNKWKGEYMKYILNLAENYTKTQNQIDLQAEDIEWFKAAMKKHVGDDWEAKTGFAERAREKYKE